MPILRRLAELVFFALVIGVTVGLTVSYREQILSRAPRPGLDWQRGVEALEHSPGERVASVEVRDDKSVTLGLEGGATVVIQGDPRLIIGVVD